MPSVGLLGQTGEPGGVRLAITTIRMQGSSRLQRTADIIQLSAGGGRACLISSAQRSGQTEADCLVRSQQKQQ